MGKREMHTVSSQPERPKENSDAAGATMDMSLEEMRTMLGGRGKIKHMKQEGLAAQAAARAKEQANSSEAQLNPLEPNEEMSHSNIPAGTFSRKEEKPKKKSWWKIW